MFTGIVEETGVLRSRSDAGGHTRLEITASVVLEGIRLGDSIAVNGCCLTAVAWGDDWWAADAVAETLRRTNLGRVAVGDRVNLERPLRLADRLGGHLVQGHVDAVGTVTSPAPDLRVEIPGSLSRYLVEKGSVAVDGCSLTVVEAGPGSFSVAIIPHTAAVTVLGDRRIGEEVNIEVDVIAKYAERLLAGGAPTPYQSAEGAVDSAGGR